MSKSEASKAAAIMGRKGGKAGEGAAKRRGSSAYYRKLAKLSRASRAEAALARSAEKEKA
jgi:hypothetical protein